MAALDCNRRNIKARGPSHRDKSCPEGIALAKDAAFFRYLAARCREYIDRSTSPIVKEQFELWLVEFEAQADMATETEEAEASSAKH